MTIMTISGKVSDMFGLTIESENIDYDGYVPYDLGVGGGDYIKLDIDISTGQIQNWPKDLTVEKIKEIVEEQ